MNLRWLYILISKSTQRLKKTIALPILVSDHCLDLIVKFNHKESDKDKEREIRINKRPQNPTNATIREKFKTVFINKQQVMDILYDLLGSTNSKIVSDIWELLSSLPFNKKLRNTFEVLPVETEKDWFDILDVSCTRKLLYCLKIVTDFAMNQEYLLS